MYFLGISGGVMSGNQDGAAALIKDGIVVAAAEEERFLRIKHASGLLPKNAIKFCLKFAGIEIKDVESVSFAGATYKNFEKILKDYFDFTFGYSPKIVLVDHHSAHAASTFYLSGLNKSIILTMDFSGDRVSTTASVGQNSAIEEIYRIAKPNSLGIFYSMLTQYLGFQKDNDEYKVMGLAAYGKPKYDLSKVLSKDGEVYKLNQDYLKSAVSPNMPAPSKQERIYSKNLSLLNPGRLSDEEITDYYKDVAASGQKLLEDIVLHLIEKLVKKTGSRNLCLAGGVSLNCSMNHKIKESGLVENLFVPPNVSDAGLSVGCCLLQSIKQKDNIQRLENPYLGPEYNIDDIKKILDSCRAKYSRPKNLEQCIAKDISNGKIAGWFQGRMEFGPRALGNRSILADCRRKDMTATINRLVKFRESFRPFAPSVLEEDAGDFFENISSSPYMTVTFKVKEDKASVVPAITHVNGTARVQTVNKNANSKYHKLISEFKKITGVPMVLNTSLNVMGQPIACSPRQAIENFYSTGIDVMGIGPFYLTKK